MFNTGRFIAKKIFFSLPVNISTNLSDIFAILEVDKVNSQIFYVDNLNVKCSNIGGKE